MNDRKWTNSRSFAMLLSFGVTFAVRIWLVGVVFGGWLDRQFFGGKGIVAMLLIVLTVIYSFWRLYYVAVHEE